MLFRSLGGGGIRLHEEVADALPPASSATQSGVAVGGTAGRWTPERGQLEWVDDGVYYSLDAPGLGLPELLLLAGSLAPVEAPGASGPLAPQSSPGTGTGPAG